MISLILGAKYIGISCSALCTPDSALHVAIDLCQLLILTGVFPACLVCAQSGDAAASQVFLMKYLLTFDNDAEVSQLQQQRVS